MKLGYVTSKKERIAYCLFFLGQNILWGYAGYVETFLTDIGIAAAYLTAEAAAQGLGTCILGWLDDEKIRSLCGLSRPVRLVVTLGYAADTPREKKRKKIEKIKPLLPLYYLLLRSYLLCQNNLENYLKEKTTN